MLVKHGFPPDYVLDLSHAALNSHLEALLKLQGGKTGEQPAPKRIVNAQRKAKSP